MIALRLFLCTLVPGLFSLLAAPFTVINSPDAAYLSSTTYIDISAIADYTNLTSISDSTLTVSFDSALSKRTAPGGGWATWSATPESQRGLSDTLPVLYLNGTSLWMTLSSPVSVFGFEAEPAPFASVVMTATFYSPAMTVLGSITRTVDGFAGARLFAASADPIQYVLFSAETEFAVGAFRYAGAEPAPIPEPSNWLLAGGGLLALALCAQRCSVRRAYKSLSGSLRKLQP